MAPPSTRRLLAALAAAAVLVACLAPAPADAHTAYVDTPDEFLGRYSGFTFGAGSSFVKSLSTLDTLGKQTFAAEVQFYPTSKPSRNNYLLDLQHYPIGFHVIMQPQAGDQFSVGVNGVSVVARPASGVSLNQWHHVQVRAEAGGQLEVWLDGQLVNSAPVPSGWTLPAVTNNPMGVGVPDNGAAYTFHGQMNFVRVTTNLSAIGTFPQAQAIVETSTAAEQVVRFQDTMFGLWFEQFPTGSLSGAGGAGNSALFEVRFFPTRDSTPGSLDRQYVWDFQDIPGGCYAFFDTQSDDDGSARFVHGCGVSGLHSAHIVVVSDFFNKWHTASLQIDTAAGRARSYLDSDTPFADTALTNSPGVHDGATGRVGTYVGATSLTNAVENYHFYGYVDYVRISTDPASLRAAEVPACAGELATPQLQAAPASDIAGGRLVLAFDASDRYTSLAWRFVGASGTCDNDGTADDARWTHEADSVSECVDRHTFSMDLPAALSSCNFGGPLDGGGVWYYEAVVEATTVTPQDPVFGTEAGRTDRTSFRVRVEVPKTAETATSDIAAFGEQITQAAVTLQEVQLGTNEFTWSLATSVQYPYELEATATTSTGNTFEGGPAVTTESDCTGDADGCTQTHTITATETDACALTDVVLETTFTIKCRTDAVECSLPEGRTTTASFTVNTDSFCAEVVEVAAVEPSLLTYSSAARTTVATDYVVQSTVFARLAVKIEAGLKVDKVELTAVDIDTLDTADQSLGITRPFTGLAAAATDYSWAWDGAAGQAGVAQADFSFLLNTNSLNFESNSPVGQVGVRLTAWATVHYTAASGQTGKRAYKVTSAGAQTASASAKFTTSTASSSGSTSSTAGSSVLGVSAGVAVAAVVGVVAVLGVAAGAAVAAKKRRAGSAKQAVTHSSSSASLHLTELGGAGSAAPTAVPPGSVPTDLASVRDLYADQA